MAQTLLIVEDDQILVRMYKTLLENHGYTVKIASNGEEGLKKAYKEHPDLILLDIRMPKMDGMTMLEKLREDAWGEKVKVIIFTNFDATEQLLRGVVKNHPTYYLVKSDNKPMEVLEHVKEVLEKNKEGIQENG